MRNAIILIISLFGFISCFNENPSWNNFPKGIYTADLTSVTDCTLPECSNDRITRYRAINAKGEIIKSYQSGYAIRYAFGYDSAITLYFCDLPEPYRNEGMKVVFSGQIIDACGIIQPAFPYQEAYFLKLNKISRQ